MHLGGWQPGNTVSDHGMNTAAPRQRAEMMFENRGVHPRSHGSCILHGITAELCWPITARWRVGRPLNDSLVHDVGVLQENTLEHCIFNFVHFDAFPFQQTGSLHTISPLTQVRPKFVYWYLQTDDVTV